jgi:hypothetical protein
VGYVAMKWRDVVGLRHPAFYLTTKSKASSQTNNCSESKKQAKPNAKVNRAWHIAHHRSPLHKIKESSPWHPPVVGPGVYFRDNPAGFGDEHQPQHVFFAVHCKSGDAAQCLNADLDHPADRQRQFLPTIC